MERDKIDNVPKQMDRQLKEISKFLELKCMESFDKCTYLS